LDSVDALADRVGDLRRRCEAAGRDPSTLDVTFTNITGGDPAAEDFDADAYLDGVAALAAVGVTWIQVTIPGDSLAHAREVIDRFGAEVIARA
jgi:hypothetical protein